MLGQCKRWVIDNYRFFVLISSLLMLLIGSGAMFLIAVTLKAVVTDFGWPRSVPSLAYAAMFMGSGIGGIFMGHLLDRTSIGYPAMIGAVMLGLGAIVVSGMESSTEFLLAYGVMIGFLGMSTLFAPLTANIVGLFERRRGFAAGVIGAGQTISGVVWPPIARYFVDTAGWRQTYWLFGIFALCTMLPLSAILFGQHRIIGAASANRAGPLPVTTGASELTRPLPDAVWMICLSVAIVGCCIAMSMPLAHLIANVTDIGHPAARAAEMLALALLAATVSRLVLIGPLVERWGSLRALFVFCLAQALTVGAFGTVSGFYALYALALVFGLGYGGILPLYPVIIRDYLPAEGSGRRTGIVILFGAIGMAIGGALGGLLFDQTGSYGVAFLAAMLANLGNLAVVGWLILKTPRPPKFAEVFARPAVSTP